MPPPASTPVRAPSAPIAAEGREGEEIEDGAGGEGALPRTGKRAAEVEQLPQPGRKVYTLLSSKGLRGVRWRSSREAEMLWVFRGRHA